MDFRQVMDQLRMYCGKIVPPSGFAGIISGLNLPQSPPPAHVLVLTMSPGMCAVYRAREEVLSVLAPYVADDGQAGLVLVLHIAGYQCRVPMDLYDARVQDWVAELHQTGQIHLLVRDSRDQPQGLLRFYIDRGHLSGIPELIARYPRPSDTQRLIGLAQLSADMRKEPKCLFPPELDIIEVSVCTVMPEQLATSQDELETLIQPIHRGAPAGPIH
jgi:hypothetical protein